MTHDYRLQHVRNSNIGLGQLYPLLRKKQFICNKGFYESLNFSGEYKRIYFYFVKKSKNTSPLKFISKKHFIILKADLPMEELKDLTIKLKLLNEYPMDTVFLRPLRKGFCGVAVNLNKKLE